MGHQSTITAVLPGDESLQVRLPKLVMLLHALLV